MKRAAVIGDLHFGFPEVLEKLRSGIFPDLVFSLGDIFGKEKRAPYPKELWRERFHQFLEELGLPFYQIRGNHDDEELFEEVLKGRRFHPDFHFLENGQVHLIGGLNVAVLGGNYSQLFSWMKRKKLPGGRKRHYVREEVEALLHSRGLDLLLTHEWDDDIEDGLGRKEVSEVCRVLKPKLHFAGNHHYHLVKDRGGRFCICLPRANEMIYTFEFEERTGLISRVA